MTRKVKPFLPQEKGYTIVDNVVFDYILPELTANGWKILCFIIRKTKGWHKEWDGLSYSQIMKGTGIKSSATVSKVLTELLEANYIWQVKADDQFTAAQYALNTALEIEVANGSTLENEVGTNSENEVPPTLENEDTKQSMKQTGNKKEGETPADFGIGQTDPLEGVPQATDGHQRAVDEASGGNGADDPKEEVIKHLRWLCAGPKAKMPRGEPRASYLKAAKNLLDNTDWQDWQGVCAAIDDWGEHPPGDDQWWRDKTRNPHKAIDHLTTHYWQRKEIGASKVRASSATTPGPLPDFITS